MFMNRWTALAVKFLLPARLHVTAVGLPSGLKVNSAVLVAAKGRGRLSLVGERPSPAWLLPAHVYIAPVPAGAPSYVLFIAGSSFSYGDHASHLRKSFTCANTTGAGAEMVAVRAMRNSEGCMATTTPNTRTITARAMRILMSIHRPRGVPGFASSPLPSPRDTGRPRRSF